MSNRVTVLPENLRPPAQTLADCVRQPSSRVRTAVIALFLLHPEYTEWMSRALSLLNDEQQQLLVLFYTAAVYLQRQYRVDLLTILDADWFWLPDRYTNELGIPPNLFPEEALQKLGEKHKIWMHSMANWAGTYENVAQHLIRYKRREASWNQSPLRP